MVSGSVASDILLLSEEPLGSSGTTTSLCSGDIGAGGSRHYIYVCVCVSVFRSVIRIVAN